MDSFTVVGARGFIGGTFVRVLRERGANVRALTHEEAAQIQDDLGDVIYASGVAWDAERRPHDTLRAHAEVPAAILRGRLRTFTFVSSTRVYGDSAATDEEACARVFPRDVYATTKLAGESLVLSDPRPGMRVVRLSNVYGPSYSSGLLLSDFLRQAATTNRIVVRSARDSEKDHVSVEDVVDVCLRIAVEGRHRIYNVAAGRNTLQGDILDAIATVSGCAIDVAENAPTVRFVPIRNDRIRDEFAFHAAGILDDIPALWESFRAHFALQATV